MGLDKAKDEEQWQEQIQSIVWVWIDNEDWFLEKITIITQLEEILKNKAEK